MDRKVGNMLGNSRKKSMRCLLKNRKAKSRKCSLQSRFSHVKTCEISHFKTPSQNTTQKVKNKSQISRHHHHMNINKDYKKGKTTK